MKLHGALEARNPMNDRGRWRIGVLASAIALLGSLTSLEVHALALGRITVQSALGEPLRGEIEITDLNPEEASSFTVGLASAEAFKAAGLNYPSASGLQIKLQRRADGKPYLRLNSSRAITEPFLDLILDASSSSGRITRDYTMLFDPPNLRADNKAATQTAPVLSSPATTEESNNTETAAAPNDNSGEQIVAQASTSEAEKPSADTIDTTETPVNTVEKPVRPARATTRTVRSTKPRLGRTSSTQTQAKSDEAGQVRVKAGDTAGKIAARNKSANISLDQMLIALLRSNPDAFIAGNINKIKAGAVLEIPNAETVSATPAAEARQLVVAQSKDFNAFRRKLADNVSNTPVASADRQASGKLQTKVEDQAQANPTPDKLTLSQGALRNKPSAAAEDKIIKDKEAKDTAARMAEMSKNISDLSKLGAAAPTTSPASSPSAVPAITMPVPSLATASTPSEAQKTNSATSSSTPASAASTSDTVMTAASDAASAASTLSAASASAETKAAVTPASASIKTVAATATPPLDLMDGIAENAVPIGGSIGLLGLLGGLFFWRRHQKNKNDKNSHADSTFLESRLQPDSFFGASGGNRVNSENNMMGSSMAYTPSQMDASGDVDPVAEADVYLAYGRDEQAEDILREALHTYPGRVAIHAKLLEIYKTRRDLKAFESVAAEAFKLTQGQGPEWAYIVELGAELDPANPLYHLTEAAHNEHLQQDLQPDFSVPSFNPVVQPEFLASPNPVVQPDFLAEPLSPAIQPEFLAEPLNPVVQPDFLTKPTPNVAPVVSMDMDMDMDMSMDMGMDFSLDEPAKMPDIPAAVAEPLTFTTPAASNPVIATAAPTPTLDDFDLGLDFDLAPEPAPTPVLATTQATVSPDLDLLTTELDFAPLPVVTTAQSSIPPVATTAPPASTPPAPDDGMMDFDLDAFSLDFTAPPTPSVPHPSSVDTESDEDPLEVKFMLAEEFNALGDTDGARSLAEEVATKAHGALKAKAQSFLNKLS